MKMIDKKLIRQKKLLKYVQNEVKVMKSLDHPNIVRFFENFEDENILYMVMEYCAGGNLLEYII